MTEIGRLLWTAWIKKNFLSISGRWSHVKYHINDRSKMLIIQVSSRLEVQSQNKKIQNNPSVQVKKLLHNIPNSTECIISLRQKRQNLPKDSTDLRNKQKTFLIYVFYKVAIPIVISWFWYYVNLISQIENNLFRPFARHLVCI